MPLGETITSFTPIQAVPLSGTNAMEQAGNKAGQTPSDGANCAAALCANNPLCKPQFIIKNKTYYDKPASSLQSNHVHAKVQHMNLGSTSENKSLKLCQLLYVFCS